MSGLRYTRVSADILFDMRLAMYRHLQRLSPRFYARTRLGDIMSRINNDIGEIQRVAAETALAWFGNVLFLVGSVGDAGLARLRGCSSSARRRAPFGIWALVRYRGRLEDRSRRRCAQRSADIGSFLIETLQGDAAGRDRRTRRSARSRASASATTRSCEALMSMQRLTYLSGGLPGLILSAGTGAVFLYGGLRVINGTHHPRHASSPSWRTRCASCRRCRR